MKNIKLNITKSDARNAGGYCDSSNCLAATAAKRQFGTRSVICGPSGITIGDDYYHFRRHAQDRIRRIYLNTLNPKRIKRTFKPFAVTLIPV